MIYEICDDNVESDGDISNDSVLFDLSVFDFQILGSQNQTDFTVTYHSTQIDADIKKQQRRRPARTNGPD